jgi:tRNA (guanine37-N1)-methyltransferase
MRFSFVTLFPSLIESYFEDAILSRAIEQGIFSYQCINPRDYTTNPYKKVDDTVTGGGAGMVMSPQPLFDALSAIRARDPKARICFMTPAGKPFAHNDSVRLSRCEHLVLVCGRYEGFDERIIETFADECLSLGDFILTGGELAALMVADATSRHLPGVLGNAASLSEESFTAGWLEGPVFTKPATFKGQGTPGVLFSGHHKQIATFRADLGRDKTRWFRPDLIRRHG